MARRWMLIRVLSLRPSHPVAVFANSSAPDFVSCSFVPFISLTKLSATLQPGWTSAFIAVRNGTRLKATVLDGTGFTGNSLHAGAVISATAVPSVFIQDALFQSSGLYLKPSMIAVSSAIAPMATALSITVSRVRIFDVTSSVAGSSSGMIALDDTVVSGASSATLVSVVCVVQALTLL